MLRLVSRITITQVTTTPEWPVRNETFIFNFINEVDINSSWANLTDTCKVTLPKKVIVYDQYGTAVNLVGKSLLGDSTVNPLMLRGDKIKVELGYMYPTPTNPEIKELNTCFDGYITRINPRIPIVIWCEDRMYQLKQIKVKDYVYSNLVYNVQDMIQEMLLQQPETKDIVIVTGSSIGEKIETNINDEFRTQDDTISSVLMRLKKEAHLNSYFRKVEQSDGTFKDELRCSGIVYFPSDRVKSAFSFQRNIISDSLEYRRLDDIKIGAKCYSLNKSEVNNGTNKNGSPKTKRERLEEFAGEKDGDLMTLYFWDIEKEAKKHFNTPKPTIAQQKSILKILGERELRKFRYTGFFGSFTTFGLPKVKHGDEVEIMDAILPERDGTYLVKGVHTNFGMGGFRQDIELHLKLSEFTTREINNGL